jgi:hypothetical protein
MALPLDLKMLSDRLAKASERVGASPAGLCTEVTATDLVIAAHGRDGGHGQGRTESIRFGVLFNDPEDRLGQALDRLERYLADHPELSKAA